jgi:hypothetical protein
LLLQLLPVAQLAPPVPVHATAARAEHGAIAAAAAVTAPVESIATRIRRMVHPSAVQECATPDGGTF